MRIWATGPVWKVKYKMTIKKIIVSCILSLVLLLGFTEKNYAKEGMTVEEKILLKSFTVYQASLTYDEICNDVQPKEYYNKDDDNPNKTKNVNILGNQQLLVARLGWMQKLRFPKLSIEDVVERLVGMAEKIKNKTAETLKEKGCASKEAESLKNGLLLYSTNHPVQISSFLDKAIIKGGGTITPPESIED